LDGESPETIKASGRPNALGKGSPVTCVAEAQFELSILDSEYRISYWDAVPVIPSSPGAVQVIVIEFVVGLPAARFSIVDGGVVSGTVAVIVHVKLAGVASALPIASVAVTLKV